MEIGGGLEKMLESEQDRCEGLSIVEKRNKN